MVTAGNAVADHSMVVPKVFHSMSSNLKKLMLLLLSKLILISLIKVDQKE
jgi:hypothetical protein